MTRFQCIKFTILILNNYTFHLWDLRMNMRINVSHCYYYGQTYLSYLYYQDLRKGTICSIKI